MEEETLNKYLRQSVEEAFLKLFGSAPEILYFDNFDELEESCIISSIGFTGGLEGNCSASFPESSACQLVGKMLGQEIDEFSIDVMDGIGEIVNMIIGGVKLRMEDPKFSFEISIPTCVKGSRMVILTDIKKTHMVGCNFKMEDIVFALSVVYKVKEVKSAVMDAKMLAMEKLKNLQK